MKRRIFIAINLPHDLKERLLEFRNLLDEPWARWTKTENIHLTLAFIGYVSDDQLQEIGKISAEVAARHAPFSMGIEKIILGPPQGPPRMVWAELEKSREPLDLQKDLEITLYQNKNTGYREVERRPYSPHLTLCRFDAQDFRRLDPKPVIHYILKENFSVASIEIMESVLHREGAEYLVVKSFSLGQKENPQ